MLQRIPMYMASIVIQRQLPVVWRGTMVTILLVIAIPMSCIHKHGARQVTFLIQHAEGRRQRRSATGWRTRG